MMGETSKQVRVDNWGIFFLQRLQLFFNKTDYCDLTLQFEGNVQLKVHRLVMNACTDYFNMLEQTCEVIDGNILVMPHDLQADVILPIVNFMYTGMLEFQMSIFDKLYNTAELMNIPVLTKLLDAQKKPIQPFPKVPNKKPQPAWNAQGKKITPKVENDLPATLPGRKLPVWKRKSAPTPVQHSIVPHYPEAKRIPQDPLATYDNTPKPTRFEWPEDEITSTFNLMDNSFDDISYTSKPLLTQDDELRASTSFDPPTHKKSKDLPLSMDIEEVKDYVKEQKIRSDLVEYDEEDDPDNYLEHIIPEKDEGIKRKSDKAVSLGFASKRVRFSISEKENKETKINVTQTGKPGDMNHTRIISEVLKKYPHLVKKKGNIRLKILAKSPTKAPESLKVQGMKTSKLRVQVSSPKGSPKTLKLLDGNKNQEEGPWICSRCSTVEEPVEFVLYYLYRKHMTDIHNEKFDSRMCKFCGHQSNKHNMLMYHQYTRHGIKPPAAYNFPKCNRCPYIALTENLLMKHKLNHTKFDLQCVECRVAFNSETSLASHMQITGHTGKSGSNSYDCQYCIKRYHTGSNLFSHIKLSHRSEARRDGIVSIDENEDPEDEQIGDECDEYIIPEIQDTKEKVKIISDIKVPLTAHEIESQTMEHEEASLDTGVGSDALNNVTGEIATNLGLVDIVVLDDNQQYILHNDQQLVAQQALTNNQPEYILPEIADQHSFGQPQNMSEVITSEHNVITQTMLNSSDIASTDELVMVLTDHDYNDGNNEILANENSNIVVLYSHPVDGQENQYITSQGNLMLNSQTGMLELRNNAATETESETQIESIEMIQREINNHNVITEQQEDVKQNLVDVSTSTTATLTNNVEPLTQNTVLLEENQLCNEGHSENIEAAEGPVDADETAGVTELTPLAQETVIVKPREERECDQEESEIADNLVRNEDSETVMERNVQEEPMEIDDESKENAQIQRDDVSTDKESHETIVTNVVEVLHEENSEAIDSHDNGIPCSVEQHIQEVPMVTSEVTDIEDTEDVITVPENNVDQPDLTNLDEKITNNEHEETLELTDRQTNEDEESQMEEEVVHYVTFTKPTESLESHDAMETVDGKSDVDLIDDEQAEDEEREQKETDTDHGEPQNLTMSKLHDSVSTSLDPQDAAVECEDARRSEVELPRPEDNGHLTVAPSTEVEVSKSDNMTQYDIENSNGDVTQSVEKPDETVEDESVETQVEIHMHEEASQNSEISQNQRELSESGEEAVKENLDGDDENSEETGDDDNSRSQDSQLSQSSHDSSKISRNAEKSLPKRNACQTTKISILDDWEDTDSQQSDNVGKKAEIAVHKLIDDWDDDDEDEDGQAADT